MSFIRDGRVFIWKKGEKDANGERLTRSAWKELYYGPITVSENMIVTEQKPEILNHPLQSQMKLKPAFNCDRSYLYRYRDDSGENEIEISWAIRFRKPEIAQEFKRTFEEMIENLCISTNQPFSQQIPNEPPPPYTLPCTSNPLDLRDEIEQLNSENEKLTRQVKICQRRLDQVIADSRAQEREVIVEIPPAGLYNPAIPPIRNNETEERIGETDRQRDILDDNVEENDSVYISDEGRCECIIIVFIVCVIIFFLFIIGCHYPTLGMFLIFLLCCFAVLMNNCTKKRINK